MKHIISTVIKIGYRIIFDYFAWMIKYSNHPEKTPLTTRYKKVRCLIVAVLKKLKVKTTVINKQYIYDGCACYVGNHLSAGDPLLYFDIFEKPIAFVGKKEVKNMPFVGRMFASADGLFLDRQDLKQELRVMMKVEDKLKNKECNIYIFPEGTRNRDPLSILLDFHKGTFRSAMRAGVPIIPVVNYGSFRILSTKYNHTEYPAIVKFLKPLMPEEYANMTTEEVAQKVQSMIQKELSFEIRTQQHKDMLALKNSNYRFNTIY